jgi:hypothetical protein
LRLLPPLAASHQKRTIIRAPKSRRKSRPSESPQPRPSERKTADHPLEEDPAVERGERIDTGKTIYRGGKESGHVPGATEQSPRLPPEPDFTG